MTFPHNVRMLEKITKKIQRQGEEQGEGYGAEEKNKAMAERPME